MADGYFRRNGILRPDYSDDINDGTVGWWALNERDGLTARDISGQNNHGTLTNGVVFDNGLSFDGTDDCVLNSIANFRSSDNTGSIVVRFKSTSTAAVKTLFSSANEASINDYLAFLLNYSTAVGSIYVQINVAGVTTQVRTTATTFNDGVEHTAILTSNGSAWSIIVDGVNQALTVISGSNNGTWFSDISNRDNISIGSLKRSSNIAFFEGLIFDVRVLSSIVSIQQAQRLHLNPDAGLWVPDTKRYYFAAAGGLGGLFFLRGGVSETTQQASVRTTLSKIVSGTSETVSEATTRLASTNLVSGTSETVSEATVRLTKADLTIGSKENITPQASSRFGLSKIVSGTSETVSEATARLGRGAIVSGITERITSAIVRLALAKILSDVSESISASSIRTTLVRSIDGSFIHNIAQIISGLTGKFYIRIGEIQNTTAETVRLTSVNLTSEVKTNLQSVSQRISSIQIKSTGIIATSGVVLRVTYSRIISGIINWFWKSIPVANPSIFLNGTIETEINLTGTIETEINLTGTIE